MGGNQRGGGKRESRSQTALNPNREEALFELALVKPFEEREAFLKVICGEDEALRQSRLYREESSCKHCRKKLAELGHSARSEVLTVWAFVLPASAPDRLLGEKHPALVSPHFSIAHLSRSQAV